MRDRIILACTDCKQRNYTSTKNKKRIIARKNSRLKSIVSFVKHIPFIRKLSRKNN